MRVLATFALALSCAVFLADYILPAGVLLPLSAACAVLAVISLLTKRKWLRGAVPALLGFSVGLGVFLVKYTVTVKPCREIDGQTLKLSAVLLDHPDIYDDYCRAFVKLTGENAPHVKAYLYDTEKALADAKPGERIVCTARVRSADMRYGKEYDRYNAGDVFLTGNISSEIIKERSGFTLAALPALVRKAVSDRIQTLYAPEFSPFLRSITLGDKSALYNLRSLYFDLSDAGLMHVAAVSGMHIAFLVGFLQFIFGNSRRGSVICIVLVWCFAVLTGSSPSAIRAAFMQSLLLLAPVVRRENDALTSLSAVLAIVLIKNPYAAANIGLQLSFGAMAGIMCFAARIFEILTAHIGKDKLKYCGWVFAAVSNSLAVMVFTLPLTVLYFGYVPVLSPLTNVLSLWAVSGSFCLTFVSVIFSFVPFIAKAAAFAVTLLVRHICAAASFVAAIPFCTVYLTDAAKVLWLAGGYVLLALFGFSKLKSGIKLLSCVVSVLLLLFSLYGITYRSYADDAGCFSVIDVGQGQSIAVISGDNTVMVDCGGGAKDKGAGEIASSYLLSRGRRKADALILTHLHSDHANGVPALLERVDVDRIFLPKNVPVDEELMKEITDTAERRGTELIFIDKDTELAFGDIRADLYAPGKAGDANERCMMCSIGVGGHDMLITADAPISAENELADSHDLSGTDLLIAGHHGSRYSNGGRLLHAADADTAIISVGFNTYGHPTDETLQRFASCGYNVLRTDLNGTVEIRIR
ncbi:MAG: ComEC/Rec2 family competence protein [Eubacteriales bacterium]|nr:ComEC/Rec2 family competence protein [Eubacteriales bacterium]